ncbi:MAG: DNA/RNA non-specific endonuclease [Prevotella sp.]|nr:DNA/RNA non-specific endonuclease [Prevotella sp.]
MRKCLFVCLFAIVSLDLCAQYVKNIELPAPLKNTKEQILRRKGYTVSYNKDLKIPNWVAWHLTAEHAIGTVERFKGYIEDEDVPKPRATNEDYRGSGWSHGHMCPAGDNKWDEQAMRETFLLTNMCPQDRSLNSGLWNRIEMDCRKWAQKYGSLYIVCGPLFYNKQHETIGVNKVVVPEAFFKVILCMQGKPKAIGFVVKNNAGTKKKDQYVNTIDEVERITGIDFFPALPDSIENKVEGYANINDW